MVYTCCIQVHVSRMTGNSLLKEMGINNKYNIMKITQGKKEAVGVNAVNCCLPSYFNSSCLWKSNSRRAAEQRTLRPVGSQHPSCLRCSCVWEWLPISHSLTAGCSFRHSFVMNILITHKFGISILLASMAGRLSCGMGNFISISISSGTEGKMVGLGFPGRDQPCWHWDSRVLHHLISPC